MGINHELVIHPNLHKNGNDIVALKLKWKKKQELLENVSYKKIKLGCYNSSEKA
jgi:hypothetical protein